MPRRSVRAAPELGHAPRLVLLRGELVAHIQLVALEPGHLSSGAAGGLALATSSSASTAQGKNNVAREATKTREEKIHEMPFLFSRNDEDSIFSFEAHRR